MKILVVEDEPGIRQGLAELLEGQGYQVLQAAGVDEGLELYRRHKPSVIILDIMMPGKNGYDMCRKIRASDEFTPILFLTAKAEEVDKVLGLELGADDYVLKPFGTHEILARIRALTRRCYREDRITPSAPFELADLRIEPAELRATRMSGTHESAQSIDLSLRELTILELFARNVGKVLSRDAILDYAWGKNYVPNSRTLDQHISTLRKKIERDPAHPQIIHTVHGAGYRTAG